METYTTKRWTEQEIYRLVQTNDIVLYRALKSLYRRQTASEQRSGTTHYRNGCGFNAPDAKFLSSLVRYLERYGYLTFNQRVCARRKLVKYNKQLTRIANKEI